jgi:hypothetical protein
MYNRKSSTNSGYLSRAELFGRSSSGPASSTLPPSHGLDRIDKRRVNGHATLNDDNASGSSKDTSQHGVQGLPLLQSARSPRGERAEAYSFPYQRSSWTLSRGSTTELRDDLSGSILNMTGGGHGPGPVQTSEVTFHYSSPGAPERTLRISSKSEVDNGTRESPLAEDTLRNVLSKANSRPRSSMARTPSWANKILNHRSQTTTPTTAFNYHSLEHSERSITEGHSVYGDARHNTLNVSIQDDKQAIQTENDSILAQQPAGFDAANEPASSSQDSS